MRRLLIFSLVLYSPVAFAQRVGGPCDGCEAIFEYGNKQLSPIDTLPDFSNHKNQMVIEGTVFQVDGKTPAANVILYVYHTDETGVYPKKGGEKGWARNHGYLRGWIKTDNTGKYTFYTFKPASYPSRTEPAHVHITIKEPDKNEYWIDAYEFEDDPLLTAEKRAQKRQYGGSGIVSLTERDNFLICKRDLILGKNVPNYSR